MADSIEQQIMARVVERMQGIQIANGYLTDIGERFEDSRPNWDEDDLPAGSAFQGTVTSDEADDEGQEVWRTMPVMIRWVLQRPDTAAEDAAFARRTIQDTFKAIRSDPVWRDSERPLAIRSVEKSHGIEYAENTFEITGTQIEFEIKYYSPAFSLES